jgi:hypothetical protein
MRRVGFGLFFLILGVGALLPGTAEFSRRYRDWQFGLMPWLRRLPGANVLYGDRAQRLLLRVVGSIFLAFGFLTLVGAIDLQ